MENSWSGNFGAGLPMLAGGYGAGVYVMNKYYCPDCDTELEERGPRSYPMGYCPKCNTSHDYSAAKVIPIAMAYLFLRGELIVSDCPFCHGVHKHQSPLGNGRRQAGCLMGEYVIEVQA